MNEMDDKLASLLKDPATPPPAGEGSVSDTLKLIGDTFRSRGRWMTLLVWGYTLGFTVLAVFTAVQFFRVEAVRDQLLFATLFLFSSLVVMMLKLWYWMLLNRNAVLRELKRLEFAVASLIQRAGEK